MVENEQSNFKLNPGSMLQIFLELDVIEQIKQIQKNENLKDERDVIIRAIQNYSKKNISDHSRQQQNHFEDEIVQTSFNGDIDIKKLESILVHNKSENLIKKLPQDKIYTISDAGMIHRFHTKILPVKFSLMCLSKMIVEKDSPWIGLNEFKKYTLDSAKTFVAKFESSSIRNNFKVHAGFPILKRDKFKSEQESYVSYARSSKRFTEQFVGRKLRIKELQKNGDVYMGGACFEMGLVNAKSEIINEQHNSEKIFVTLSKSGKDFVNYKNDLINFIYNNKENEPSSIFSQQETEFYFKNILPEFKFENMFVEYLMKNTQIDHTHDIKKWFKEEFHNFCKSEFPLEKISLEENIVRIYSNTIMGRLMEFGIFTKDPKSKSGPYTRRQNMSNLR